MKGAGCKMAGALRLHTSGACYLLRSAWVLLCWWSQHVGAVLERGCCCNGQGVLLQCSHSRREIGKGEGVQCREGLVQMEGCGLQCMVQSLRLHEACCVQPSISVLAARLQHCLAQGAEALGQRRRQHGARVRGCTIRASAPSARAAGASLLEQCC